jgi:site-specific recombinase XerD
MQVLLRTGLRIGELTALRLDDLRLTQRTGEVIVRHGKGDRRRTIPLTHPARSALREWLTDRHALLARRGQDHRALWLSRTVQPLSARSITKIVTRVMTAAGMPDSAHALRHTLATRLIRDHGHDLALVADILGHADTKTTRRYARSTLEAQRAALTNLE